MSDLTESDRRALEKLFGMSSGYMLNFSDRTFGDFFDEHLLRIDDKRYKARGTSKANRLRTHWELDGNRVVGRVIGGLIDHAAEENYFADSSPSLIANCQNIAQRLLSDQLVAELEAPAATGDERDFEVVSQDVGEAIKKNQPEGALDRLHTFVIKFVRVCCEPHGIGSNARR